jgi:uncharacterized protein
MKHSAGSANAEVLICDTSGLLAFFDASDKHHVSTAAVVDADPGPFVVSPYVLAELDYLLVTKRGDRAELSALRELSGGAWTLPEFDPSSVGAAAALIEKYGDQAIGVTDASLVALAGRFETDRILTHDHRHFDVLRTVAGDPFVVLPERPYGTAL